MHLGLISLHPVTLPIGNEIAHAVGNVYNNAMFVYLGIIKPELTELLEVISLL